MARAAPDLVKKAAVRKRHAERSSNQVRLRAVAAARPHRTAAASAAAAARRRAEQQLPAKRGRRSGYAPPLPPPAIGLELEHAAGLPAAASSKAPSTTLKAVASAALRLHGQVLATFGPKGFRGADATDEGWLLACAAAECQVTDMYQQLLCLFQTLLRAAELTEVGEEAAGDRSYSVFELQGKDADVSDPAASADLGTHLAQLRADGEVGLARDALCALLSVLACRKEMCWVEAYDEETPVRGYFIHALASSRSTLRLACVASPLGMLAPTSLLVTSRLPLKEALEGMDYGGPLKHLPPEAWLGGTASDRLELGLQEIEPSEDLGKFGSLAEERAPAREVVPRAELQRLLLSRAEVLSVDVYVAQAPRSIVLAEGLSELIQAQFSELLRRAKAAGMAVVFQLGSHNPHILARKVYMRPAFLETGLRFGYLRWRPGPGAAWGREQPFAQRVCMGLQLP